MVDLSSTGLDRARAYQVAELGSLDAIHLATADPLRPELTDFVTYGSELTSAATDLGFPVTAPAQVTRHPEPGVAPLLGDFRLRAPWMSHPRATMGS